jgi:hypothetical protein
MALPKPSNALLKECKKYKLKTPMHKAFCDLIVAGWDKNDAYAFSGLWNHTYSTLMNQQDAQRLLEENTAIIEYIDTRIKEVKAEKKKAQKEAQALERRGEDVEIDMTSELSKEMQLKELLIAKQKHPVGSKEWLDIKKLIADISKVKQDELKDEEEFVHFYVPIQCHQCKLYEDAKKKLNQKISGV